MAALSLIHLNWTGQGRFPFLLPHVDMAALPLLPYTLVDVAALPFLTLHSNGAVLSILTLHVDGAALLFRTLHYGWGSFTPIYPIYVHFLLHVDVVVVPFLTPCVYAAALPFFTLHEDGGSFTLRDSTCGCDGFSPCYPRYVCVIATGQLVNAFTLTSSNHR